MVYGDLLKGKKIVLGVTGGIAAYKSVYLLRMLVKAGASVQVIGTANSLNFVGKSTWESLSGRVPLFDTFETIDSSKIGHIMLAQEVDVIVIAPATGNIIAKAACGIADDLLSTVLMAATVPVLFAPGMNSAMYENPANLKNIEILQLRKNIFFADCKSGELACKTVGKGRMAEPKEIFSKLEEILYPVKMKGIKWLVTGGATREYLDPVRFITNASSGKTGLAIADAAFKSGGEVTFIGVNSEPEFNPGYSFVKTVTAAETAEAVKKNITNADIFVMSAAIADYSPNKSISKIKKSQGPLKIELLRTEDILLSTVELMKKGSVRIGFAAETENLEDNSLKKLNSKKLDLIVGNLISNEFNPFGSEKNSVKIFSKLEIATYDSIIKSELGRVIVDSAIKLFLEKNES